MMKQAKKTNWLKTTILVILACGIVGLALTAILFFTKPSPTYATATLVFTFVIRMMGVEGPSMIPTLQEGDRLLVLNSLICGDYQRGDINDDGKVDAVGLLHAAQRPAEELQPRLAADVAHREDPDRHGVASFR